MFDDCKSFLHDYLHLMSGRERELYDSHSELIRLIVGDIQEVTATQLRSYFEAVRDRIESVYDTGPDILEQNSIIH